MKNNKKDWREEIHELRLEKNKIVKEKGYYSKECEEIRKKIMDIYNKNCDIPYGLR